MATVVRHVSTGASYVLIGTGFGAFQSKKPNWLLGDLMADTSEGQHAMACVCDADGRIFWVDSSQLIVDSVDGKRVREVLNETA